ncbi:MAG: M13 family metallopeptidase [Candidatus Paceibacterota bacterium]
MTKPLRITRADMNSRIRPQDDFYHFAGGGWLRRNPIPTTESTWGSFHILRDTNRKRIHKILKELARKKRLKKNSNERRLRDLYLSGMNTKEIERLGLSPLSKYRKKISAIKTTDELLSVIAELHMIGVGFLFSPFVSLDEKNSEKMALYLFHGGLGLPEREYYLSTAKKFVQIRKKYIQHIVRGFALLDVPEKDARARAEEILHVETELAHATLKAEELRDVEKTYNKMTLAELSEKTPRIDWGKYLKKVGVNTKKAKEVIVGEPAYMKRVNVLLGKVPLSVWKHYLEYSLVFSFASLLSARFEKEGFSFYGTTLAGLREMKPRWQRVYGVVNSVMSEAVGEVYVERYFSKNAKEDVLELISHIKNVLYSRIKTREWMSEATKKKALKKLSTFRAKIGYPEKKHTFPVAIKSETYLENVVRIARLEWKREMKKLEKKIDREEWFMGAHVVNAYYWANQNEIVFPAGILQPPFYDEKGDPALNYGAIGAIIGHEITHGFDDQGSLFDHKGNLKHWWTTRDRKEFLKRAELLVKQYNNFIAIDDVNVNGRLTLGENIADLGGVVLSYYALLQHMEEKGRLPDVDGFTPEQRFFLGFALSERAKTSKESARARAIADPHAPSYTRVNGPLAHFLPFYHAFGVKRGDMMYRPENKRAEIW